MNNKKVFLYTILAFLLIFSFIKSPYYNAQKFSEIFIKIGIEEDKYALSDLAVLNYKIALLIDKNSAWAYNALGSSYYYKAKRLYILNNVTYRLYSQAIINYSKAIELAPNYYFALVNRGNCYERLGKYRVALKDYEKALEFNKNDPDALYGLSMVYGSNEFKQYDKAIEALNKLIELKPKHQDAYFGLGWCYDFKGNYVESIRNYQKVVELNPLRVDAWINLSYVSELKLKDYEKGLYYAEKALQLNPHALYALSNKSFALIGLKRYDEAMTYVNMQLKIDANHSRAYSQRGQIELAKGDKISAKKDFEKALKLEKENNYSDKDTIIDMIEDFIKQCQ